MDRRKTLAGLSPAQLNSRASLAPGRGKAGAAGKLPLDKALSRMSLAGPVARRSSAYTTKASSGVKSDPRPISDKGFQAACIRTVIAYLAAHGFEYAITPKVLGSSSRCRLPHAWTRVPARRCCSCRLRMHTPRPPAAAAAHVRPLTALPPSHPQTLASPTTKDFTNVMMFLYRQFDPSPPKTFKMEDEVGGRWGCCKHRGCCCCCMLQGLRLPLPADWRLS